MQATGGQAPDGFEPTGHGRGADYFYSVWVSAAQRCRFSYWCGFVMRIMMIIASAGFTLLTTLLPRRAPGQGGDELRVSPNVSGVDHINRFGRDTFVISKLTIRRLVEILSSGGSFSADHLVRYACRGYYS